jgi:hypothetical protein|tara:strand:- start:31092 stop:31247 length:156 start_codon:yes stop_codon:yes gene_type:complete
VRSILTIVLVNTRIDDVGLTVKRDIADTEALPVTQQPDEVLPDFAASDVEA